MARTALLCQLLLIAWIPSDVAAQSPARITILNDAFGDVDGLEQDWGFAALIEHDGRRILFDTGARPELFRHNVERLGIDLSNLDFVVISHRHGDHTGGLHHLREVNPAVTIYTPNDEYFGAITNPAFFERPVTSLPDRMRYFGGRVPDSVPRGGPWKDARIHRVADIYEIAPGIRVVRNVSQGANFRETPELSLVIDTPDGPIVFVGCSHPGIEQILESIDAKQRPVRLMVGGLHLVSTPDTEVERLAAALRSEWRIESIAPGHCTGEPAFAALQRVFGGRYVYAGLGTTIVLPTAQRARD